MVVAGQTNLDSATRAVTNGLRDLKPPMEIPSGWEWLWWVAGALGALALLGGIVALVIILIMKNRRAHLPPPIPPHVRAKERLEEALRLIGEPKPFVIVVSDTLRAYLEECFDFRAPERTTEEFLHELQGTTVLEKTQKESLGDFLQRCDLVKFAKYEPTETELRKLHGSAYRLVEETEPVQEPQDGKTDDKKPEGGNEPPAAHPRTIMDRQ